MAASYQYSLVNTMNDETDDSDSDQDASTLPKAMEFVGAGRRFLAGKLSDQSSLASSSKRTLSQLLDDANASLDDIPDQVKFSSQPEFPSGTISAEPSGSPVFLTLLDLFDQSPTVSSAQVIKQVALKIPANVVPGKLDAREFILSLLYFMSLEYPSLPGASSLATPNVDYPKLPLIAPLQATPDLEKRVYEKAYDWNLKQADFAQKLHTLERDFLHSPVSLEAPWLPRSLFVPLYDSQTTSPLDLQELLQKGKLPNSMTKPVQKRAKKSAKGEKTALASMERSTSDAHQDDISADPAS